MVYSEEKQVVENHRDILQENWVEYKKYFSYIRSETAKNHLYKLLTSYYSNDFLDTITYNGAEHTLLTNSVMICEDPLSLKDVFIDLELKPIENRHTEGLARAVCESLYSNTDTPEKLPPSVNKYLQSSCGYAITRFPHFTSSDELQLDFSLTDYTTAISQSQQLYYELFDKTYAYTQLKNTEINSQTEYSLPYRNKISANKTGYIDYTETPRFLTLTVLPLFKSEGSYMFPLAKRTEETFRYPTWKTTLPESEFTYRRKPLDEFDLQYEIDEAFAAQLFSHTSSLNSLYRHKALEELRKLRKAGDIEVKVTGISINAIDHRPSLLAYFEVPDESYLSSFVFETYNEVENYELIDIEDEEKITEILEDDSVLPQTKRVLYDYVTEKEN